MLPSKALGKTFGHKCKEVRADWKKLHNEFHDLYLSANIIWLINSRKIRWSGLVARMEGNKNAFRVLVQRSLKKRNILEDLGIDGRISKYILTNMGGRRQHSYYSLQGRGGLL